MSDQPTAEERTPTQLRAEYGPDRNPVLDDGMPRYLFRGQNREWYDAAGTPLINSTFARVPETDTLLVGQAYTTLRRAGQLSSGTWGYAVNAVDGLAVFQHYGWYTPSIDFTGTIDVALAFALHPAPQGPLMYLLDRTRLPQGILIAEHGFLLTPLNQGGTRHRWLRQDGFGVMNSDWQNPVAVRQFNLWTAAAPAITQVRIRDDGTVPAASYVSLRDKANDPTASRVQDVIRLFCDSQFGPALHVVLVRAILDMYP